MIIKNCVVTGAVLDNISENPLDLEEKINGSTGTEEPVNVDSLFETEQKYRVSKSFRSMRSIIEESPKVKNKFGVLMVVAVESSTKQSYDTLQEYRPENSMTDAILNRAFAIKRIEIEDNGPVSYQCAPDSDQRRGAMMFASMTVVEHVVCGLIIQYHGISGLTIGLNPNMSEFEYREHLNEYLENVEKLDLEKGDFGSVSEHLKDSRLMYKTLSKFLATKIEEEKDINLYKRVDSISAEWFIDRIGEYVEEYSSREPFNAGYLEFLTSKNFKSYFRACIASEVIPLAIPLMNYVCTELTSKNNVIKPNMVDQFTGFGEIPLLTAEESGLSDDVIADYLDSNPDVIDSRFFEAGESDTFKTHPNNKIIAKRDGESKEDFEDRVRRTVKKEEGLSNRALNKETDKSKMPLVYNSSGEPIAVKRFRHDKGRIVSINMSKYNLSKKQFDSVLDVMSRPIIPLDKDFNQAFISVFFELDSILEFLKDKCFDIPNNIRDILSENSVGRTEYSNLGLFEDTVAYSVREKYYKLIKKIEAIGALELSTLRGVTDFFTLWYITRDITDSDKRVNTVREFVNRENNLEPYPQHLTLELDLELSRRFRLMNIEKPDKFDRVNNNK